MKKHRRNSKIKLDRLKSKYLTQNRAGNKVTLTTSLLRYS